VEEAGDVAGVQTAHEIKATARVGDFHVVAQQLQASLIIIESQTQRQLLRRLAGEVAELAAHPVQDEKRQCGTGTMLSSRPGR
jgi:hypothetical protein